MKISQRLENIWSSLADEAEFIAGILFVIGLILLGLSFFLDLHQVSFDGNLQLIQVPAFLNAKEEAVALMITKEVGYVFAPNWGLTGLILLPLAIMYILRAKAAIEPMIRDLIKNRMLVSRDLEPVEPEHIIERWRKESGRWTLIGTVVLVLIAVFVLVGDFIPVVARWLIWDAEVVKDFVIGKNLTLLDDTYEFDWSIAATFKDPVVGTTANLIFSFIAYLFIAIFGSAFLFAAFIYFISVSAFFSSSGLRKHGLYLIPNLSSGDKRLGFEVLERFFDSLINACLLTATITVSMHLQNVYLRTPEHMNIGEMVFSQTFDELRENLANIAVGAIFESLTSTSEVLKVDIGDLTLQTFTTAVALFLLSAIVFMCLWGWLRMSAIDGKKMLLAAGTLDEPQKKKLRQMKVWPVGWISLNFLIFVFFMVGLSMWYVNFVSLVMILFLLKFVFGLGTILYREYIVKPREID